MARELEEGDHVTLSVRDSEKISMLHQSTITSLNAKQHLRKGDTLPTAPIIHALQTGKTSEFVFLFICFSDFTNRYREAWEID